MVRVAAEDGRRAVELLREHDADQLMRPGERGKAENQIGFGSERRVEAVGAADDEAHGGAAVVAPARELLGKGAGGDGLAALVEGNNGAVGKRGSQALGFFRL